MPLKGKKYPITFEYLGRLVKKPKRTVQSYFYSKGWSLAEDDEVRAYLVLFL